MTNKATKVAFIKKGYFIDHICETYKVLFLSNE